VAIVGRDAELESVTAFLERDDVPRALLIEGQAGVGKTTLWRAAVQECRERGWCVLECAPTIPESGLPYGGLGDLLESVLDEALPSLLEPRRRALEGALLIADVGEAPLQLRAIGLGVLDVLRWLAERSPVAVAIDDLQWLDQASDAALQFALRRLTTEPMLLIASRRIEDGPLAPPALVKSLGDESAQSLAVDGLSLGAMGHLLRARVERPLSRPEVSRVHDVSGGNPLFALEVARSLNRPTLGPPALPPTLRELIASRLAGLSPAARRVALVSASLAHPRLETVERLAGEGLVEAVDVGVLVVDGDRVVFTHPLFASGIYASAAPEDRRAVHAELAAIVDDPAERARHLASVATGPDEAVASTLEEAAASVRARSAPDNAAALAERAAELTPAEDAEAASRRLRLAGEYASAAGDTTRALQLLDRAIAAAPPGELKARGLTMKSRVLYSVEPGHNSVRALLEQAVAEATGIPAMEIRALHFLLMVRPWNLPEREAQIARLNDLVAQEPTTAVWLLKAVAVTAFYRGEGLSVGSLEQASELERFWPMTQVSARSSAMLGQLLERACRFDEARPLLEASYRAAHDEGDESSIADRAAYLAELELAVGNWDAAGRLAAESVEYAVSVQQPLEEAIAESHRARIAAHLGDETVARAAAARSLALTSGSAAVGELALAALGLLELSLNDFPAAERHLSQLEKLAASVGAYEPAAWKYDGDRIETVLALGDIDQARFLVERLEERSVPLASPWSLAVGARCHALLHAAEGDLDAAVAAFELALDRNARLGMPFERARTLLALGQLQRRLKHRAAARITLGEAAEIFRTLGARIWVEKANTELGRISGRTPAGSTLTQTEGRIAALVSEGYSNKEVAAQLFLTVHTVEVNLTRIYAKLGIHSRRELQKAKP
jgi:DNA-binding CsgD family transcriptional regulator